MVGKDTFVPTDDMVAALKAQGVIDKAPTSQKDLAAVQAAFNPVSYTHLPWAGKGCCTTRIWMAAATWPKACACRAS